MPKKKPPEDQAAELAVETPLAEAPPSSPPEYVEVFLRGSGDPVRIKRLDFQPRLHVQNKKDAGKPWPWEA